MAEGLGLKHPFFGLGPDDRIALIWEPEFLLGYYAGITPHEAYFMPVAKKRWYMERINKELTKTSDAGQTQSRALQHNTPDVRAVTGMQRQQVPSRLRRFS